LFDEKKQRSEISFQGHFKESTDLHRDTKTVSIIVAKPKPEQRGFGEATAVARCGSGSDGSGSKLSVQHNQIFFISHKLQQFLTLSIHIYCITF
jgi:hypothetical protein